MNTCEQCEETMSAFIDGEADDAAGAELFAHMGMCPACRRTFAAMSAIRPRMAAAAVPEVPVRLDRRIRRLHAAPAARVSRLREMWTRRLTVPAPAFALALLIVSVTILVSVVWLRGRSSPPEEQQVMYIMSMPAVEVEGVRGHTDTHIH